MGGTVIFTVYLYRAKDVRGKRVSKPMDFVSHQWGRVTLQDKEGKEVGGKKFGNLGEMVDYMTRVTRKAIVADFREKRKSGKLR